jgi:hypothetical protein
MMHPARRHGFSGQRPPPPHSTIAAMPDAVPTVATPQEALKDIQPASHARITSSRRRQQTRRHDSSSARYGVVCCGARRRGDGTDGDVTGGVIISGRSETHAHTHRSRCGSCPCSVTCLRRQQHVSHATRDNAGEAATNGPQRPLTAAGPAVGAAAGAAACITHHSDPRTVTAAHTTGQHTHADGDVTSLSPQRNHPRQLKGLLARRPPDTSTQTRRHNQRHHTMSR